MDDKNNTLSTSGIIQYPNQSSDELDTVPNFQFITFQDPHSLKSRGTQRLVRSHGAKKGKQERTRRLVQANANFRVTTDRRGEHLVLGPITSSIAIDELDPFQSLAVNGKRLQALMRHRNAPQSLEPVCNITDGTSHQRFHTTFRCGLSDPALSNAILLVLSFAENGYKISPECLEYKSIAMTYINQKISSPSETSISATMGAILLLIGVDWRLGDKAQAQIHLNGMLELMRLCDCEQIHLNDGIKRATFWQDLLAAWITGSKRVFSHDVFSELHWRRDPFLSSLYTLPNGFQPLRSILGDNLIEVIEDIHALQHFRETSDVDCSDPVSVISLDNQQAWLESRLHSCLQTADSRSGLLSSCIITLFLCVYMMFTSVWASTFVPSRISTKLLQMLQCMDEDASWSGHEDILLWCVLVGGTFSRPGDTRSAYLSLARRLRVFDWPVSWLQMEAFLKSFIWSSKLFHASGQSFWEAQ